MQYPKLIIVKQAFLQIVFSAYLLGTIFFIQQKIDFKKGAFHTIERVNDMLSGPILKVAVMEYREVTADLLWLQAIQFVGKEKGKDPSGRGYDWFYKTIDLVTDLDPQFSYAYQTGGVVLSVLSDNVQLSNALLNKGMRQGLPDWQIPFYLGFNYTYHLKDNLTAARYMEQASKMEDHPPYLPLFTAQLYSQGDKPETGLLFLQAMYLTLKDETLKEAIAKRIMEIQEALPSSSRK